MWLIGLYLLYMSPFDNPLQNWLIFDVVGTRCSLSEVLNQKLN